MVEGAEAWRDAKSIPDPAIGADAGVAGEVAALVARGPGSKGGWSIIVPAMGRMWLTVWGVIICRF